MDTDIGFWAVVVVAVLAVLALVWVFLQERKDR